MRSDVLQLEIPTWSFHEPCVSSHQTVWNCNVWQAHSHSLGNLQDVWDSGGIFATCRQTYTKPITIFKLHQQSLINSWTQWIWAQVAWWTCDPGQSRPFAGIHFYSVQNSIPLEEHSTFFKLQQQDEETLILFNQPEGWILQGGASRSMPMCRYFSTQVPMNLGFPCECPNHIETSIVWELAKADIWLSQVSMFFSCY